MAEHTERSQPPLPAKIIGLLGMGIGIVLLALAVILLSRGLEERETAVAVLSGLGLFLLLGGIQVRKPRKASSKGSGGVLKRLAGAGLVIAGGLGIFRSFQEYNAVGPRTSAESIGIVGGLTAAVLLGVVFGLQLLFHRRPQ